MQCIINLNRHIVDPIALYLQGNLNSETNRSKQYVY